MKKHIKSSMKKTSEKEVVVNFIIKSEQMKEKAFRDYVRSEIGTASAGKRIILNNK